MDTGLRRYDAVGGCDRVATYAQQYNKAAAYSVSRTSSAAAIKKGGAWGASRPPCVTLGEPGRGSRRGDPPRTRLPPLWFRVLPWAVDGGSPPIDVAGCDLDRVEPGAAHRLRLQRLGLAPPKSNCDDPGKQATAKGAGREPQLSRTALLIRDWLAIRQTGPLPRCRTSAHRTRR
jgi:hypothetical protein